MRMVWKISLVAERKSRQMTCPSYRRLSSPGSSITTGYRSKEANSTMLPPDPFPHLLTEPSRGAGQASDVATGLSHSSEPDQIR